MFPNVLLLLKTPGNELHGKKVACCIFAFSHASGRVGRTFYQRIRPASPHRGGNLSADL